MSGDAKLSLQWLRATNVRNLVPLELTFSPGLNVIYGDNGHGKTSVLEAVYLVATTKSFRSARPRDARTHDAAEMRIRAAFSQTSEALPPITHVQTVAIGAGPTSSTIDGNPPDSLAVYAARSPIVVFHPGDLELSAGPATARRKLLDRLVLYATPSEAKKGVEYLHAMRARQELLRRGIARGPELEAYEQIAARAGARLTLARAEAARALAEHVVAAFAEIGDPSLRLSVTFEPGGSADVDASVAELAERRSRDARGRAATWGPHKDDLALSLGGYLARRVGSQGQHRALTLALKAAEAATVRAATGVEPIQLLDDVSSELDPDRTRALLDALARSRAQILISTTRPELIRAHFPKDIESRSFRVIRGQISAEGEGLSALDPTA